MDVFAHGLWSGAIFKAINKKLEGRGRKTLNMKWAVFWGIFPDLFAFAIPFVWLAYGLITGGLHSSDIPRPAAVEPAVRNHLWAFNLASSLYDIGHSLIVFAVIFLIVRFVLRRAPWELLAWPIHVLIDIPTHSYRFYPTPLFWPVSHWKFTHGFSWADTWFLALNYSAIIIVYLILYLRRSKPKPEQT